MRITFLRTEIMLAVNESLLRPAVAGFRLPALGRTILA